MRSRKPCDRAGERRPSPPPWQPGPVGASGEVVASAQRLVLAQSLRAQPPAVHRVVGIALHRDRPAVADADEHPAADRAVAARRAHPVVGRGSRSQAGARLVNVGVAITTVVDAAKRPMPSRMVIGDCPAAPAPEGAGHVQWHHGHEEQPAPDDSSASARQMNAARNAADAKQGNAGDCEPQPSERPRPEPAQLEPDGTPFRSSAAPRRVQPRPTSQPWRQPPAIAPAGSNRSGPAE